MRAAPLLVTALLLTGCGGGGGSTQTTDTAAAEAKARSEKLAAANPPPAPAPPVEGEDVKGAKDVCHVVGPTDWKRWSRLPQTVSDAHSSSRPAIDTLCNMVVDPEDGLSLEWRITKETDSYAAQMKGQREQDTRDRVTSTTLAGTKATVFERRSSSDPSIGCSRGTRATASRWTPSGCR